MCGYLHVQYTYMYCTCCHYFVFVCRYMNDPVMVDLVSDRNLVPDSVVHEVCDVEYQCTQTQTFILIFWDRRL